MRRSSSTNASAKGAERGNQKKQGGDAIEDPGLLPSNDEGQQVGALDYLYLDMVSPPFQACLENMILLSSIKLQDSQPALPSASSEALRCCRRNKIDNDETARQSEPSSALSSNQKIELAAENFIHSSYGTREDLSITLSGLSTGDANDIQLLQDLLSCAEKVCSQQYDCARNLLQECSKLSLTRMNVIQRLVYYFAEALCVKIDRETGRVPPKVEVHSLPQDSIAKISAIAAIYQKLPLSQVVQFSGIQTVADHVSQCRKVNIIDLNICCGIQHMILLQTLAARSDHPLHHVKITAIAMNSDPMTEEAGPRLKTLAESLNLSFSFHVITLEHVLDHQSNAFDLDPEETVVVYAAFALKPMIPDQNRLESLMRVIRNSDPSLMILAEVEANVNSPVFVNRFVEALFFYGAYFDYVEDCLDDDGERASLEAGLLSCAIRNIVAAEGEERRYRIVGINVWRAFFSRFGMVGTELCRSACSHARSVLEKFECRDSCLLCMKGECLIVSWKETPMCSLSAWKFQEM